MKVNQKLLKKVSISERNFRTVDLINIATGEIEKTITVSKQVTVSINDSSVSLMISADGTQVRKTSIYTEHRIRINTITAPEFAVLLASYKEQLEKHTHDYDALDLPSLYAEQALRTEMRAQVVKEEEKYTRKLLNDEVKMIAKRNVDAKRPPVTSVIPTKITLAIEE